MENAFVDCRNRISKPLHFRLLLPLFQTHIKMLFFETNGTTEQPRPYATRCTSKRWRRMLRFCLLPRRRRSHDELLAELIVRVRFLQLFPIFSSSFSIFVGFRCDSQEHHRRDLLLLGATTKRWMRVKKEQASMAKTLKDENNANFVFTRVSTVCCFFFVARCCPLWI